MNYTYSYGWSPSSPPRSLTLLMACLAITSIASSFLDGIFLYYLGMSGPQALLSLSTAGLKLGYLWQPITHLFVLPSGNAGLSLYFFFELFFSLYILWIMGTTLINRVGTSAFFRFYFTCGAVPALLTLLFYPSAEMAGPSSALIGIITAWVMLHPESELLLFFVFPIKAKWLFGGLLAIMLLTNLSHLNFPWLTFQLLSVLVAYLYTTIVWELASPFAIMSKADDFFNRLGMRIRNLSAWKSRWKEPHLPHSDKEAKIYDFHTGTPLLDDDAFMDSVLEKISQHGEKSLTWNERTRMMKISEAKARHHDKNNSGQ